MRIVTLTSLITLTELRTLAGQRFGDMVKAVVDLGRACMALDADLHADLEAELLAAGSRQENLWGINLYPDLPPEEWLEFHSLINVRPSQGNRSREVEDPATRHAISTLVEQLVQR